MIKEILFTKLKKIRTLLEVDPKADIFAKEISLKVSETFITLRGKYESKTMETL